MFNVAYHRAQDFTRYGLRYGEFNVIFFGRCQWKARRANGRPSLSHRPLPTSTSNFSSTRKRVNPPYVGVITQNNEKMDEYEKSSKKGLNEETQHWIKMDEFIRNCKSIVGEIDSTALNRAIKRVDDDIQQWIDYSSKWMNKMMKSHVKQFAETLQQFMQNRTLYNNVTQLSWRKNEEGAVNEKESRQRRAISKTNFLRKPEIQLHLLPSDNAFVISIDLITSSSNVQEKELSLVLLCNDKETLLEKIELLIDEMATPVVKNVTANTAKLKIINRSDGIEIRMPIWQKPLENVEKSSQNVSKMDKAVNLQIRASLEEKPSKSWVDTVNNYPTKVKDNIANNVNPPRSDIKEEIETLNSSARIPSTIVPWWASEESFNKIKKQENEQSTESVTTVYTETHQRLEDSLKLSPMYHESEDMQKIKKKAKVDKIGNEALQGLRRAKPIIKRLPVRKQNLTSETTTANSAFGKQESQKSSDSIHHVTEEDFSAEETKDIPRDISLQTKKSKTMSNIAGVVVQYDVPTKSPTSKNHFLKSDNTKLSEVMTEKISEVEKNIKPFEKSEMNDIFNYMKPVEKKDDGTLIDYGMKIHSRQSKKTAKIERERNPIESEQQSVTIPSANAIKPKNHTHKSHLENKENNTVNLRKPVDE